MESDRSLPHEPEFLHSQRLTLRDRLAQLAIRFMEAVTPADLGDVDEEET